MADMETDREEILRQVFWQYKIRQWYPEYKQRSYFIPPIFMNRTYEIPQTFAGAEVYVTAPPITANESPGPRPNIPSLQESDVRDDRAHVLVLRCLRTMLHSEVMFVISKMDFKDYLNLEQSGLPVAGDIPDTNIRQGDFDLLVIHRHFGLLVGEIKSIGGIPLCLSQQTLVEKIEKRVKQAIRQLGKAEDMIRHLVHDLPNSPRIQKTLMLPNMSSTVLRDMLSNDSDLLTSLCNCLDVPTESDPVPLCVTSDTLTCPDAWWQQRMTEAGLDPVMNDDIYLSLVARFAGPASTVRVASSSRPRLHSDMRTEGQAVAETGWRFSQLVLHPSQLEILHSRERLVFLTGPPGCGKSTVLFLKALDWIQKGHEVQVLSTWSGSFSMSHFLSRQLEETQRQNDFCRHRLQVLEYHPGNRESLETAVRALTMRSEHGQLFIISDEIRYSDCNPLCKELLDRLPTGLHFWTASVQHREKPDCMMEIVFSEPLRTPPRITREVRKAINPEFIHDYSPVPSPLPTDGPEVRIIEHSFREHSSFRAVDCDECGLKVGKVLRDLQVGSHDTGSRASSARGSRLQKRDVFVLCDAYTHPYRDGLTRRDRPTLRGFLLGLGQLGFLSSVVRERDRAGMLAMVNRTGPDRVVAAGPTAVRGLERPVVVFLDSGQSAVYGRLDIMSRTTAFLVWVKEVHRRRSLSAVPSSHHPWLCSR